jgi:hypothetical protein
MRKDNFKKIEKESKFCVQFFENEDNDDNIKKIFNKEMLNELFEKFESNQKDNDKKEIKIKKIDDYNGFYYGECILKKNKEIIKHGRGILINKDLQAMAKGQFKKNKLTGKVIKIFNDGTYYEGDNKNWVNEGKGFCYFPNDKRIYYGEWKKNKWNGKGTAIFPDGTKYEGEWKNNKFEGYGEFDMKDGKKYYGFFKSDKRDGFGIFYWPENKFYIGFWKDGKQHGKGKYIQDSTIKYGLWNLGKKVKFFDNEDDFEDNFDDKEEKYSEYFKWGIDKLKNYMRFEGYKTEDNYNNNKKRKSKNKKRKNKIEEEKQEDSDSF